jgi:DNA polymerase elongation subunit (family B)
MILFPSCTLQQAAAYGKQLSQYFGKHLLQAPHVLEFEKVLWPAAFYKKKMYMASKYEQYDENAVGKVWARGLSSVRRDTAVLVKDTVLAVMDQLLKHKKSREDIIGWLGQRLADIHNSAVLAHHPDAAFPGSKRFALADFMQSAGISKGLDEFDVPNAAVAIARQMLEENQHSEVGKNSRVTFIVTKAARGAKRSEQVTLPSRCEVQKTPLDAGFYTGSVIKKVAPMLSILFAAEERQARRTRDVFGRVVEVAPVKAADRDKMLGQNTAETRIATAWRANAVLASTPGAVGAALRLVAPAPASTVAAKRPAATGKMVDPKQKKLCFTL